MKPKTKFEKMTGAQNRVAIANDIIKQINGKQYTMRQMLYIRTDISGGVINQESAQTAKCEVCAVGALFISAVRLFNQYSDLSPGGWRAKLFLKKYFTTPQIEKMERIFELHYDEFKAKEKAFADKYEDKTERTLSILRNIITNKGTFKP